MRGCTLQIEDEEKAAKEKKKKKVKEVSHEWQLVNKQKPIWMRTPEEITKEEVRCLLWASPLAPFPLMYPFTGTPVCMLQSSRGPCLA